jgi:transposase
LAVQAMQSGVALTVDAEEADRLELSLDLLEMLALDPDLAGWDGLGFVVQAYQKRCPFVIDWIIDLARRSGRRIMVRLGMKFRKCAAVPGKADPQLQFKFLNDELLPRLEEAQRGERRVFFVDAAHFVLGAFLGMIWSFTRIFVPSGCGRQRYNILGAVETRDHDFVSIRTTGSVNSETVCELLGKLDEAYPGEVITMVMDNARYQRNKKVFAEAERLGIELLFLPSYSPNLNLIERVWRLVKAKCLRNRHFKDFTNFRATIDEFIDSLAAENHSSLKSLVTENFQVFENPKI